MAARSRPRPTTRLASNRPAVIQQRFHKAVEGSYDGRPQRGAGRRFRPDTAIGFTCGSQIRGPRQSHAIGERDAPGETDQRIGISGRDETAPHRQFHVADQRGIDAGPVHETELRAESHVGPAGAAAFRGRGSRSTPGHPRPARPPGAERDRRAVPAAARSTSS